MLYAEIDKSYVDIKNYFNLKYFEHSLSKEIENVIGENNNMLNCINNIIEKIDKKNCLEGIYNG